MGNLHAACKPMRAFKWTRTHTHTHTHTPTSGRDADAIPSASSQQQHPALLKHGNLKKDEKTKER